MKNISHSRVNFILLILIAMWTIIILFTQAIPNLKLIFRVTDSIIETMPYGYENMDDFFKQIEIIYPMTYNILYILTFTLILIFSTITIFQPKFIKILGVVILTQNIVLLALSVWDNFWANELNNIILIDIKVYLVLTIIVAIIFAIISTNPKVFCLIFGTVALLQCLKTISLVIERINHLRNIHIIIQCFDKILILILYCIVLFFSYKNKQIINK